MFLPPHRLETLRIQVRAGSCFGSLLNINQTGSLAGTSCYNVKYQMVLLSWLDWIWQDYRQLDSRRFYSSLLESMSFSSGSGTFCYRSVRTTDWPFAPPLSLSRPPGTNRPSPACRDDVSLPEQPGPGPRWRWWWRPRAGPHPRSLPAHAAERVWSGDPAEAGRRR